MANYMLCVFCHNKKKKVYRKKKSISRSQKDHVGPDHLRPCWPLKGILGSAGMSLTYLENNGFILILFIGPPYAFYPF